MQTFRSFGWLCGLMLIVTSGSITWAESASPANDSLVAHLPEGALATLEVAKLETVIERLETSNLLSEILASPQWKDALKQDPVQKALAGKALAEGQVGMSLWQFAKTYFGDRSVLGIYPPSQPGAQPDGVLIIRVKEATSLIKLWDRLTPLLPLAGDKLKLSDYEGGGHRISLEDGNQVIVRDRWVVVSKVKTLLDQTVQNLFAAPASGGRVSDLAEWKQMTTQLGTEHEVQFFLNLNGLTKLAGHRLIPEKLDNPVFSLLLGGYLELAAGSPYVGATLDLREDHLELRSTVAGDSKRFDNPHKSFVLDSDQVREAGGPPLKSTLNGFSLTRDFASWYRNRESLLVGSVQPGFDKFETGLATFLPGRDFGSDVLPLLGRRLTIVTAPQSFTHLKGKPGVQLPGFALMLDLAKPEEANDVLNLVFQTIVLVSNLQANQEGRQPFVLSSETYRDTQVAIAKYVKQPEGTNLPISYNFQPASARVGNRYAIATNVEMCRHLIDSMLDEAKLPAQSPTLRTNGIRDVYFDLSPTVAAELLEANAQVLHAQALQQGKTADQAKDELNALLKLLRQLSPLTLTSTRFDDRWQIELRLGWK